MWTERMFDAIPEIQFLQTNTDGVTIRIPKSKISLIRQVNDQLSQITSLSIEEVSYKKMIINDVNNYIGIYDDYTTQNNHLKLKGCFEIDKEYHKDPSMRVVALALKNYFVNGIPIKETVYNDHDIFDFCLMLKTKRECTAYYRYIDDDSNIQEKILNRITRYYMSNQKGSGILVKRFEDGRNSGINIGSSCILFNTYEEKDFDDYQVNYLFYIKEANKIKDNIIDNQLYLFD